MISLFLLIPSLIQHYNFFISFLFFYFYCLFGFLPVSLWIMQCHTCPHGEANPLSTKKDRAWRYTIHIQVNRNGAQRNRGKICWNCLRLIDQCLLFFFFFFDKSLLMNSTIVEMHWYNQQSCLCFYFVNIYLHDKMQMFISLTDYHRMQPEYLWKFFYKYVYKVYSCKW